MVEKIGEYPTLLIGGFFDNEVNRVEPVGEYPFAPKVLPRSPEWTKFEWYAWQGSNLRPSVPETDALVQLSYRRTG
jgi:hypothetical protein